MKWTTVLLRVGDLGFADGAKTRELLGTEQDTDLFGHSAPYTGGRPRQLGLELCPPELGPVFRLEYRDQPLGERVYVAMRPIVSSDGEPRIFVVEHNPEGLSLDAVAVDADMTWNAETRFVFCMPPKAAGTES